MLERSAVSSLISMLPQPETLEVRRQEKQLFIGIPKETSFQENRIALMPDAVALLVNNGHEVVVETNAGKASNFQDSDFADAGARIAYDTKDVYKAEVIVKVAPPSVEELEMMQPNQNLLSILQLSVQKEEFIKKLAAKRVTAIGYEFIHDESGAFPIIQAMSEIVGSTAILIAAEYLSNAFHGKGELLGGISGIPPTEVVIIGAGTVAEYAARAALGLGATVKVFDNSIHRLRRLQNRLGRRIFTSIVSPNLLLKELHTADVAIGALRTDSGRAPVVVSEQMVSEMRVGSVIVDVSIDQGGCFETSQVTNHTQPVFKKYGVIHYCVPNIASRVSRTASTALSNIVSPIVLGIGREGGIDQMLFKDRTVRNGVYLHRGSVTNRYVSEFSKLPLKDLDLIMAARI